MRTDNNFFWLGAAWVPKVPGGSPFSQLNESEAVVTQLSKTFNKLRSTAKAIEATRIKQKRFF